MRGLVKASITPARSACTGSIRYWRGAWVAARCSHALGKRAYFHWCRRGGKGGYWARRVAMATPMMLSSIPATAGHSPDLVPAE